MADEENKSQQEEIETEKTEDNLEEAEVRTGLRDQAIDEDASESAKESEVNEEDKHEVPSFFVDEDARERIEVDILFDPKDGGIVSVSRVDIGIDFSDFKHLTHSVEWFEFSVPDYNNMSTYRQRSSVYRKEAGRTLVDGTQLRNFFLIWHLKDWSVRVKDGKKVELTFNSGGQLSDDSITQVFSLPPTLVDVVLTSFERRVILT